MQYETRTHLCALVEDAGHVQRFVQQELQDRLGVGAKRGQLGTVAKTRTVRALKLGHVLRNGSRCTQTEQLSPGDVVMVHKAMLETEGVPDDSTEERKTLEEPARVPAAFFEHYGRELPGFAASAPLFLKPQPTTVRVDSPAVAPELLNRGFRWAEGWPVPAMTLDSNEASPPLSALPCLAALEQTGEICQQGLESMLSVHALGVRPNHRVLNLCAVQLGKTTQILHDLQGEGLLVANDVNLNRATRNFRKAWALGFNCAPLVITVAEPQELPASPFFDRVLCDEKCSGDGTIRRSSAAMAAAWCREAAQEYQALQVQTLRVGLQHLRCGGRLVYSTCSLSIVENEDVVRKVLADGTARLVAVDWATRFLPGIGEGLGACIRVLPTPEQPDVGGAFIAVLERLPGGDAPEAPSAERGPVLDEDAGVVDSESVAELAEIFGMEQPMPLVRAGRLLHFCGVWGCPRAMAGSVCGRGVPVFRDAKPTGGWQVCNEGAALVARWARRRKVTLATAEFQCLLATRIAAVELTDGPAVVTSGSCTLAGHVSGGCLDILTADIVAGRYLRLLGCQPGQQVVAAGSDAGSAPSHAPLAATQGRPGRAPDAYTMPSARPVHELGPSAVAASGPGPSFLVAGGLRYQLPFERWEDDALPREAAGARLSAALARFVRDPQGHLQEESWWEAACASGRVLLEVRKAGLPQPVSGSCGSLAASDFKQASGDEVVVPGVRVRHLAHVHERCVRADLPTVLAGTERFLVVNKPAGLPSQSNCRGFLNVEGVLASMGYEGLHLAHRLDQPVSGVLVMARSTTQQNSFLNSTTEKRKTYVARVRPPLAESHMAIDAPLGWDGQRAVVDRASGKAAVTNVRAIRLLPDDTQLVECSPIQGRRHQIRAHLAHVGSPIANDALYGGDSELEEGAPIEAFQDQDGKLSAAFALHARAWCASCAWTARALAGLERRPQVRGGIWLHSRRYQVPAFGLDVEAPLPAWAAAGTH